MIHADLTLIGASGLAVAWMAWHIRRTERRVREQLAAIRDRFEERTQATLERISEPEPRPSEPTPQLERAPRPRAAVMANGAIEAAPSAGGAR